MKSIFLLCVFLTAAQAMADVSNQVATDQAIAARYAGSVAGDLIVCQLVNVTSGRVIAQNAMNPSLGALPNDQLVLKSGDQHGLLTLISTSESKTIARLDLWSVGTSGQGAEFQHAIAALEAKQFAYNPVTLLSVDLKTDKTADGRLTEFKLTCRGSKGTNVED